MTKTLVCLVMLGSLMVAQTTESIPFCAELSLLKISIIEGPAASGRATVWMHVARNAKGDITRASVDFGVRCGFPGPGPQLACISAALHGRRRYQQHRFGCALAGLATAPASYYVNLHTATAPGGAIRRQLQTADSVTFSLNATPRPPVALPS